MTNPKFETSTHNKTKNRNLNKLTEKIIGLAIKVHKELGPGFVERIYQRALYLEFKNNHLQFEREKKIPVYYNKALLGYEKVDFLIQGVIIVELKCVSEISDIHKAQVLSYLKAANTPLGLIINFARPTIEIKRLINSVFPTNSASLWLQEIHSQPDKPQENGKTATTETQNNQETQNTTRPATTEARKITETQKNYDSH